MTAIVSRVLLAMSIIFLSATAYQLFGVYPLLTMSLSLASFFIFIRHSYQNLRRTGFIELCGPKLRKILLERSILDIFRDIIYFPYLTKIIGTFLTIATYKPHPNAVPELIGNLPPEVGKFSSKKGLLSLAPSALEAFILPQNGRELLPEQYGKVEEKWDRIQEYHQVDVPPHEQTFQQRIVHFLDSKLGWSASFIMLIGTLIGAYHMHPRRFKKMMLQNATFCCLIFSILAVVIKLRRLRHKQGKAKKKLIELGFARPSGNAEEKQSGLNQGSLN